MSLMEHRKFCIIRMEDGPSSFRENDVLVPRQGEMNVPRENCCG